MPGPLSGVRMLDLSLLVPGPFCSMILGDLGADIIRVEDPDNIDRVRIMGRDATGRNIRFETLKRGKRSICIRLKNPSGRAVLLRLVEKADVLLEGSRPGAMRRRGLGYDDLRPLNPGLVYCSLSGFGQ